jgi:Na+-driven multidrug efflux pump
MAIGAIASMTFQVVDTYFVAQLGTEELAAMAFTFPVVMILHAIAVGLGTGVTSVGLLAVAAKLGQKRSRRIV